MVYTKFHNFKLLLNSNIFIISNIMMTFHALMDTLNTLYIEYNV